MKFLLISIIIISLILSTSNGQILDKKRYQATKIATAPVINGILDDEAWKSGDWAGDFTQNQPHDGLPASQRTEFKILSDDNYLYVAIKAYDTSLDSIVNRLTRRDEADGDIVGVIFDSFHDLRTGFFFGVSAGGIKCDQKHTNDGRDIDISWDPNWWVKTSVNKEGWVAEMKIPFSQVRFKNNSGDIWGLDVIRVLYRKNETSFWQHIPIYGTGFTHLMGELTGLQQIKPRKIFDITPYGVAKAETFKKEPLNPFLDKGKSFGLNGGIDAKIGVTNNMTMDLAINPDFGQVEADPSEVNLTAYETFFKEKRPFFIEGSNITDFGLGLGSGAVGNDNLFYSRRIGRRPVSNFSLADSEYADIPTSTRILGAAKLSGKSKNGLSLGFIESVTMLERAEIKTYLPSESTYNTRYENVEPLTNYFVGRVQKDFKNGNTILGGILTGTNRDLDVSLSDYMHKSAYTGGLDFTQYFKEKAWMFNFNVALSDVAGSKKAIQNTQESSARYYQRPDKNYAALDTNRTSLSGSGGRMKLMKLSGHWILMSAITWKSPGFEINDLGYMRQADQISPVLWAHFQQLKSKGIYRNYYIESDIFSTWNFEGDNLGKGIDWNANINLKNFWNLLTGGNITTSALSTDILRGGPKMIIPGSISGRAGFTTDSRQKLMATFYINGISGFEKYSKNFNTGIDLIIKPTNYLSLTISPGFSKSFNELQYVTRTTYGNDDRYIFASINRNTVSASLRVNLNFSPDLTLQYWGQPFIATGKYSNYKLITNQLADQYHDRFHLYTPDQISSDPDNYYIDENKDGINDYNFSKPDFNVQDFLSNLVLRWEYNPGSTLFLVWSQTRSGNNGSGNLAILNNLGNLFSSEDNKPHNVFLLKFSYRFGLN
jgi:hypothetical protein